MFDSLFKTIGQHFSKGKPSIATNILSGKPWDQGTSFAQKKEVVKMPKEIKAPKPAIATKIATKPTLDLVKAVKSKGLTFQAPQMPAPRPQPQVMGVNSKPKAVPLPTPVPDNFEAQTMETFDNYQIPREAAYGIAGGENGRINKFNIAAHDSNPGAAINYDSELAAATSAAKFLSGQAEDSFYSNGKKGKEAFAKAYTLRKDPVKFLAAIRDAGYAGDPATWKQRSIDQARAIGQRGAGEYFNTWDEFIRNTPAFKKWYKKY